MSILDRLLAKPKTKLMMKEIGAPGTEFFSGFINEEFNPDLRDRNGLIVYDKMRKNDAQVYASLQAVKLPVINARWYVVMPEGEEVDETTAEEQTAFIEYQLFEKLKWKTQLKKILTYLEFGFKYLEKNFEMGEDGKVEWRSWGDRLQLAHLKWSNDNDTILGALQQLPTGTVIRDGKILQMADSQPFIPMEKLMLFSHHREGDNFSGTSLLRAAYKHWWFKDTLYKIEGISAERYGVGIPWVQLGDNNSNQDRNKAEELAKNLRSNESNYIVTPGKKDEGMNVEILTPDGDPKSQAIKEAIEHHNRMITMNILAPFLDLGSGNSGSFALSKTQAEFFYLSLQSVADDIIDVVNEAIKELIKYNWPDTKNFPKLAVSNISQTDPNILATALSSLITSGIITVDEALEEYVRNALQLPEMTESLYEKREEQEEQNKIISERMIKEPEGDKPPVGKADKNKFAEKKKMFKLKTETTEREKAFMQAIDENEAIIAEYYKSFEAELKQTEADIKKFLLNKYDKVYTRTINGVKTIKGTQKFFNECKSGVNDIMKKFNERTSGGRLSKQMMKEVAKLAIKTNVSLDKKLATIVIPEGQIKSFMGGHISNMTAFVFNEGRRVLERVHDNVFQEVALSSAKKQTGEIVFNRNIYKLSVTAHPRGLFRNIIADEAQKNGIKHFKVVVPESRLADLNPSGKTLAILFMILTAQQINQRGNTKGNADSVGGIGIHHSSFEMYLPVDADEEDYQTAEEQRREILNYYKD
jgi:hypothetical protein